MYPHLFSYHRAGSLKEAATLLQELGEEAKLIAGGQSLIPLMKMRLARPAALIDINHIPGLSGIERHDGELRLGALARHADIEASSVAAAIPIVHDCAAESPTFRCATWAPSGGRAPKPTPAGTGARCC
ncbi:MAG: FAD binding domain-containing protein [Acidobacteriia bacterium]|nr:FAD binding domain-containing protein [Terriglobia bacterium]